MSYMFKINATLVIVMYCLIFYFTFTYDIFYQVCPS